MSYTYDSMVAEDIATDALVALWSKLSKGENIENHLPFLFGVVKNKLLHYYRHKKVEQVHQDETKKNALSDIQLRIDSLNACDPNVLFSKEVTTILNDGLTQMGEGARQVFCLSRYKGLTNKEISQAMGISEKTVEFHMTKALKILKGLLKDYLPIISFFF